MQPIRLLLVVLLCSPLVAQPIGTKPLKLEGDITSQLVDGVDRFLLRQISEVTNTEDFRLQVKTKSLDTWQQSTQPFRDKLSLILGLRDARVKFEAPEVLGSLQTSGVVADTEKFKAISVRWPVLADPAPTAAGLPSVYGSGLFLKPNGPPKGRVVAIPHCDHSPEQISGLAPGIHSASQYARRLAEAGFEVIVPALVSREFAKRNGRGNLTNREYLYRSSFELGRQLAGYEIQKVLGAVDWFSSQEDELLTGVIGYGEGGHLALLAAAVDQRIDVVCVSGAAGFEFNSWEQPLDRNFFGIVRDFSTSELGSLVLPRRLIVEFSDWPEGEFTGSGGGGPAVLRTPDRAAVRKELDEVANVAAALKNSGVECHGVTSIPGDTTRFCSSAITSFAGALGGDTDGIAATMKSSIDASDQSRAVSDRMTQMIQEIDRHNQALLRESPFVRKQYLKNLNTTSIADYEKTVEQYRDTFRTEVIGEFDVPLLPFNARSRRSWETDKWTGHEIVLDVFEDVIAYGVLLVPKNLKPDEKRPVVVCQHGLEGRPTDIFLNDHRAYHDFAAKLCERGFITFAPQNLYIFRDRFRTLQRKANSIGRTLFSVIVPQHQQIVNWLKTQPGVDPDRIAFYGLSYGGKSAMRIPALVTDYCLSICSADFNEWVRKNASTRHNFSYVWTGEYEIFEWDLGSTFNYFEMAALICPRPFMVERGHFDGVGEDEWVAYEYAKVRNLYAARLKIPERTEIEWFDGPHTINGKATFDFLHRHLKWPKPQSP